jgi:hypothetical protein
LGRETEILKLLSAFGISQRADVGSLNHYVSHLSVGVLKLLQTDLRKYLLFIESGSIFDLSI